MGYNLSISSENALRTCHPKLQRVARRAIEIFDFRVLEGHRNEQRQNELFYDDPPKTKVKWPNSKHNTDPSRAFDIAPFPVIWPSYTLRLKDFGKYVKSVARFYLLAGVIMTVAEEMGIKLRWGGDWDGDWDLFDQKFDDLGHFELAEDEE